LGLLPPARRRPSQLPTGLRSRLRLLSSHARSWLAGHRARPFCNRHHLVSAYLERLAFETAGRERSLACPADLGRFVSGPLRSEDQTQKLEPAGVAKPSRTVLTDVVRHGDAGTVRAWI